MIEAVQNGAQYGGYACTAHYDFDSDGVLCSGYYEFEGSGSYELENVYQDLLLQFTDLYGETETTDDGAGMAIWNNVNNTSGSGLSIVLDLQNGRLTLSFILLR